MEETNQTLPVQQQDATEQAGEVKTTKESSAVGVIKQYGPDVSGTQAEEIARMSADPRFHMTPIPGTTNAVVNITEAVKSGIEFYRKKDNRIHGRDMDKTGLSLMKYGAQLPLSVCPVKEAIAAGVQFERFPNDPNKDQPISEDAFMVIEGHGRFEYLLGKPLDKWPVLLGSLPVPNGKGEIHLENGFIELNLNNTNWLTKDYIAGRLGDPESHSGWRFIKELEDKGLGFTIASIFATGKENVITKKTVLNATAEEVEELFKYLDECKRIFEAAESAFTTEKNSAIRTKVLPNKIFYCWYHLQGATSLNATLAADYMVSFLTQLKEEGKAAEINAAKKDGDRDRDTVRKELFSRYFDEYNKANPIV